MDVLADFEEKSRQEPKSEEDELLRPLTPEEQKRMRFAHSWAVPQRFATLGPRYGRGLSLYLAVLPDSISSVVSSVLLGTLRILRFKSRSALDLAFGHLSDVAKKLGPTFNKYWMAFVNLNTLGGYRDVAPISTQVEDLKSWATGDKVHTFPDSNGDWTERAFLEQFAEGIAVVLNELPDLELANRIAPSLDDFVRDPALWGNTGATSHRMAVKINASGRELKAGRDKMTTAMLLDPSVVKRYILDPHVIQHNKPIMKRETAKVRAVVNSDDILYLKMAFVSSWLELALHGNKYSTLFMNGTQRANLWQRMAQDTATPTIKMPLDQSHFDWQQNRRMLHTCVSCIRKVVEDRACDRLRSELLSVVDSIDWALCNGGFIHVREAHLDIPIEKGVMSGWRWTALLDTLMNVGELHAANALADYWGCPGAVRSFVAQGDDDQVTLASPSAAILIAEAYKAMNFEVNPGKFWIAQDRDEFLRLVSVDNKVVGYVSRTINNILWRNPVTSDPPAGELSIRSQLAQWNLVAARGGDSSRCHELMLRDMCGRSGLSKQVVWDYLRTPAPYGGAGLVSPDKMFTPTAIFQRQNEKQFTVASPLPGLRYVHEWTKAQGFPERVFHRAVNSRIPRQGLRLKPDPPKISHPQVVFATPAQPRGVGPQIPRMRPDVPEFVRTQVLAELIASRDFDKLRSYYDEVNQGFFDHWRHALTQTAFGQLLTDQLPMQQPTVWGRGIEQTAQVWHWSVNGILQRAWFGKKLSVGWFRAQAASAESNLVVGLERLLPVSG